MEMLYYQIVEETCILRSEIITLVTISNVWNSSEGQKECPGEACIVSLVYTETSVILIYILGIFEARDSQSSFTQWQRVGKNAQMLVGGWVHC